MNINIYVVSNCQKGYIELMLEKTGMSEYITDFECYGNTGSGKADKKDKLDMLEDEICRLRKVVYRASANADDALCSVKRARCFNIGAVAFVIGCFIVMIFGPEIFAYLDNRLTYAEIFTVSWPFTSGPKRPMRR